MKARIIIQKMDVLESFASFKIIENSLNEVPEKKITNGLEEILQNRKPFKNFKYQVENSDYRED